jgi:hypothetical protein
MRLVGKNRVNHARAEGFGVSPFRPDGDEVLSLPPKGFSPLSAGGNRQVGPTRPNAAVLWAIQWPIHTMRRAGAAKPAIMVTKALTMIKKSLPFLVSFD